MEYTNKNSKHLQETRIDNELKKLDKKLSDLVIANKKTLSFEEAAAYLDLSKSYLYLLTSTKQIPHYKPSGKRIYFDRQELDQWVRQNRIKPNEEIEIEAASYTTRKGIA
jgi:excisionase family DNA binding protein